METLARTERSKRVSLAIVALFLVGQVWLVFFARHLTLDIESYPNTIPSPRIFGEQTMGQTFVAGRAGLARIDVLLGTHRPRLENDLDFRLYEGGTDGPLLAQVRIAGPAVRNNLFHPIVFDRISGSRGRTYFFVLSAPEAKADTGASIWANPADILPAGHIVFNGQPTEGDCVFRAYARRTIAGEWSRIAGTLPGPFGSPIVFAGVALLLEAAFVLIIWKLLGLLLGRSHA
jgi:hypothetical protein